MNIKPGRFYGVSLGPGDPSLITRKSWALLNNNAHWTYPVKSAKSQSYALDIIHRSELQVSADSTALIFPMTHDKEKLAGYWLQAANQVLEILHTGKDVLFLVEGDASTYSTFSHLARTIKGLDNTTEVETVPGITSFCASAARLQRSLAEQDDTIAIIPAGYGVRVIDEMLENFDSLILLKVKPLMDDIINLLEHRDLLPHSAFIEKAGTPDERIITDLRQLRGEAVNYLSLILISNPYRTKQSVLRGCRKKTQASALA